MTPSGAIFPGACLVDTNILLRCIDAGDPMQAPARQALQRLSAVGASLWVAPQNLIEFWAVATRPLAVNGLGLTPVQAATEIANIKAAFQMLVDIPAVFTEWERLAVTYMVRGKQAHDARLVAMMKVHGISQILTFDIGGFSPYATGEGIAVIDPAGVNLPPP